MSVPSACFLHRDILEKMARMDPEETGAFTGMFEGYRDGHIPWYRLHWLYIRAQAERYRAMTDYNETVRQMLWVNNIMQTHQHLMWFGILCHDRGTLELVLRCYDEVRERGVPYFHRVWEHFKTFEASNGRMVHPLAAEAPTEELKAEFHPQLVAENAPIRNAADYAQRMKQIGPQEPGGQTVGTECLANAPPTVVYSWDCPTRQTAPIETGRTHEIRRGAFTAPK